MDKYYFNIPGKPIPKKTHRETVNVDWKNNDLKRWTYNAQRQKAQTVRNYIRYQYKGLPLDCAVFLHFAFHFSIPKYWAKRQQELARSKKLFHIRKPDASNLAKFYEDCMKGIVINDDSQVVWVTPIKEYVDGSPYTEIWCTPFEWSKYEEFLAMATEREIRRYFEPIPPCADGF